MREYWDLYNEKRELLGKTIERGKDFHAGEFYVAAEVWTVNSKNQILVTQRHPDKIAGGFWEFSGGGVPSGESTADAARRELKEELGIEIEKNELNYFTTHRIRNCFLDIFIVFKDIDVRLMKLQPDEVIDAKWVDFDELERMIESGVYEKNTAHRYEKYKEMLKKCIKA